MALGVITAYLALILLQVLWHFLLPPPMGNANAWLAIAASLPLLFPLKGILQQRIRSMTWGGFLVVLYFVIGIMEAWTSAAQRLPALTQVAVCLVYVFLLAWLTRRRG